jgi:hypothetical protein
MTLLEREVVDGASFRQGAPPIACQPRSLGSRRVHVAKALEMSPRARELERLAEDVGGAWVAAPRTHATEGDQRRDPADRADAGVGQDLLRQRRSLVPAPEVDERRGQPRPDVRGVHVVLRGERDELARCPLGPVELVHLAQS